MANEEKKKKMSYTTGRLNVLFAHIVTPDYGTKEYPDPDGSFTITAKMDQTEYDVFRQMIQAEIKEGIANMEQKFAELPVATRKKLDKPVWIEPGSAEYDRHTEEATGNVLVRFKTKAAYKDRLGTLHERKVPVFDSMQQIVKLQDEPGYGSIVRVNFTPVPYFIAGSGNGGITFYLNAIQILKLNASGAKSAADYGFEASDDESGFMAQADGGQPNNLSANNTGGVDADAVLF